jgi:tetratricopeptide (TPR) repeat protein
VDRTVINQPAAGIREPYGPGSPARTMAQDQVVVGDIPAQRSGFQPRPTLLARLSQDGPGPSVVTLTGTRGVGKTQLAAAYARARLAGGWRLIVWVNARDRQSLLAGLAEAAETATPSGAASRPGASDPGQAFRQWLEADGSRCLLVFDDAEDLGLLQSFVPAAGAARVLITMAREPIAGLGTRVPVDVFSAEEALALLDGRTGMADEAGASAVAAELGHLPLALDQAAVVIAKQHLGYAAYLAQLRGLPVEDYLVQNGDGIEQPYQPGLAAVCLLSLQAVRAADPVGVCTAVMEVMAVLTPAAVRCDLLRLAGQAGILLGGGRRVAASMVDQALERLNERSLLSFSLDGQTVSVHNLVARVVRERLARRGHLARACGAVASTLERSAEAFPKPLDHAAVREMASQVTALTDNVGTGADDARDGLATTLTRLRLRTLSYLIELGDSAPEVIALGEPLMADLERLLGPDHPDSLTARDSLAAAYQAAGRGVEAIPLFEQTLVARVRLLGPDHPDTLTAQNNLAAADLAAGRDVEAILMFRMTLAARERLLGADHPDTLRSENSLAAAYKAAGQTAEAIPLVEKVLAVRERALGASHPKTLGSRNNLAAAYREAGRAPEAVPMLEETLADCERVLGADDPRTEAVRHNLLLARQEAGDA